ncbi:protein of unknown function [Candidatus Hydrogenisulfobacillus filiaventi]|uniref:Uncharacterized protein n=1 Tax=Candidatus Hydrogenisulfobacillus filiaventi TaxID=2707344 RepID=A0A6F8ZIV7_9FIRM|nr:protein of unknown function [Candidatus Hydrogenisulfobacillus filiaventi]
MLSRRHPLLLRFLARNMARAHKESVLQLVDKSRTSCRTVWLWPGLSGLAGGLNGLCNRIPHRQEAYWDGTRLWRRASAHCRRRR